MIASNKINVHKERLYESNAVNLLKSAIIYGANASGKSNFVDVLQFMKHCVLNDEILYESYNWYCRNHEQNKNQISSFAVRLLIDGDCYEYGFSMALNLRIIKDEWIVLLNENRVLYQRNRNGYPYCDFDLGNEERNRMHVYMNDFILNDKSLFLREMNYNKRFNKNSKLNIFHNIYKWFTEHLRVFKSNTPVTQLTYNFDECTLNHMKKILCSFDLGIEDIKTIKMSQEQLQNKIEISLDNVTMRFENEIVNVKRKDSGKLDIKTLCLDHGQSMFEHYEESNGTKRIFDLLDIFLNTNKNSVYVIDEMERSLHPNLMNRFIELLNEYQKQSNIQVIFTMHESSIMKQDLFRRDQIWFVERDINNDSRMYSLDTFNERFDKQMSKAYLDGRYGAVPCFKPLF